MLISLKTMLTNEYVWKWVLYSKFSPSISLIFSFHFSYQILISVKLSLLSLSLPLQPGFSFSFSFSYIGNFCLFLLLKTNLNMFNLTKKKKIITHARLFWCKTLFKYSFPRFLLFGIIKKISQRKTIFFQHKKYDLVLEIVFH